MSGMRNKCCHVFSLIYGVFFMQAKSNTFDISFRYFFSLHFLYRLCTFCIQRASCSLPRPKRTFFIKSSILRGWIAELYDYIIHFVVDVKQMSKSGKSRFRLIVGANGIASMKLHWICGMRGRSTLPHHLHIAKNFPLVKKKRSKSQPDEGRN